jgi:hypothetical protein
VKLILITTKLAASEQRLETHLKQIKELLANGKGASSMKETDPASSSASPLGERKKP